MSWSHRGRVRSEAAFASLAGTSPIEASSGPRIRDPLAPHSDHALDWVNRFEGPTAFAKRRPAAPAPWAQLQADIEAIPAHLPARATAAAVTGTLRQATAF